MKKGGKCIAETEQCPAYSVQDGYKHARQSQTCILQYLQTLSEGSQHWVDKTLIAEFFELRHFQIIHVSPVGAKMPEGHRTFPAGVKLYKKCKVVQTSREIPKQLTDKGGLNE